MNKSRIETGWRGVTLWITALILMSGLLPCGRAQDHLVPLAQVQQDLRSGAAQRAQDIHDIETLLARPEAQQQLTRVHLSSGQVKKAISLMSDAELARLAARARTAGTDVQGGIIKTILAIIGAIVVIIIVVAILA